VLVRFAESFTKDLRHLREPATIRRVRETIEHLEGAEALTQVPHVKKLSGKGPYFRLRVGDYRIGMRVEGQAVTLMRLLHRREIYRFFP
jgi:mRNA interferase RelE/StbE